MRARRTTLASLVVLTCIGLFAGNVFAVLEVVQEQHFDFTDPTPWNTTFNVDPYIPANFGGLPLAEVMVELKGTVISDISVTADDDLVILDGAAGAVIQASSAQVPSLSFLLVPGEQLPGLPINLVQGETRMFEDLMGMSSDMDTYPPTQADRDAFLAPVAIDVEADGTFCGFRKF